MAAVAVVSLPCFLMGSAPKDVEADTNSSSFATINVQVERNGEAGGFISCSVPASALSGLTLNSACTITVSQGSGTLSATVTQ